MHIIQNFFFLICLRKTKIFLNTYDLDVKMKILTNFNMLNLLYQITKPKNYKFLLLIVFAKYS